jgi:hypothetical protein
MAKAYYGMVYEQKQIFTSFVLGIFFFALQSVVAFWIIDADVKELDYYSICATVIMVVGGAYTYATPNERAICERARVGGPGAKGLG